MKKHVCFVSPSSVITRWLIVVVGCAVLETAQPMIAAESDASVVRSDATLLYPQGAADHAVIASDRETRGGSSWLLAGSLLLCMGGGWLLVKRRGVLSVRGGRPDRKIMIEETRSLGNRQYLVVAGYEGRRFLLGVTPGQIQMLSRLDAQDSAS